MTEPEQTTTAQGGSVRTQQGGTGQGEGPRLGRTVDRLANRIAPSPAGEQSRGPWHLTNGERAELRRIRPGDPPPPIFWRLVVEHLEPHLPKGHQSWRDRDEKRWMIILRAMAESAGFHDGRPKSSERISLGRALMQARVAERRLYQLLRARGSALVDQLRLVLHQITSRGLTFDQVDLAWLVLSEGRSDEDSVRRRIARQYFRAQQRAKQEKTEQQEKRSEA